MKSSVATASFHGNDWATDRPALAQALATLDDLHALTLGFAPDASAQHALEESDMLRMMADLAQSALNELDLASAEMMPSMLNAPFSGWQAGWSAFEARQLLNDLLMLCVEARDALKRGTQNELSNALTFELGYLTGRVKELVKAVDGSN